MLTIDITGPKFQQKKEKIPESIAIEIDSPEESEFWQKRAFKAGFTWASSNDKKVRYKDNKYLQLYLKHDLIDRDCILLRGSSSGNTKTTYHSIRDAEKIQAFLDHHSKPKAPVIDGHRVRYEDGKIKAGCWSTPRSWLNDLHRAMDGNKVTHVKIRGVEVSREQIEEVIDYVNNQ